MPDFEQPEDWTKRPHVVVIVDESGSMSPSRTTTISAINEYITSLKNTLPGEARITIVKFDSGWAPSSINIERVRDKVQLSEFVELTADEYTPHGGTPLFDAIGTTIRDIDQATQAEPAPVFLAILTDGEENSSHEFTQPVIKQLITERKERGWTVTFMGVDIDAYAVGHSFGVSAGDTLGLKRGKIAGLAKGFADSTSLRYSTAVFASASGQSIESYAVTNATMDSFTEADKADLESDD